MIYRLARILIVAAFSAAGLAGFGWLVTYEPAANLPLFVPGMDGKPAEPSAAGSKVLIGQYFRAFDGLPSKLSASWPGFRGPFRDNISRETVRLARPSEGWRPPELWRVELGEGHAGAAVAEGRVYVLDYDERRQADALRCFSLEDGQEIWRRWYTVRLKRNHGISRAVPAVSGRYVVSLGPSCHLMCCDARSGELLWGLDLVERFAAEVPLWYTGQCPLIDGSQAVVAVGGEVLLAGIDLETGRLAWRTPNPRGLKMSHSSVMIMELGGARTYVYAAIGGIVGVSAEPEDRGRLLWESLDFDATVIAPSPVAVGGDRVFVTAGYGSGSMLFQVTRGGEGFALQTLYRRRPAEGFACEHQTPILWRGLLFGILPKDAGARRTEFACWHPDGRWVWSSGETRRFGLGPYLLADGLFIILNEDGILTLAEASTEGFHPLGSAKVLEGPDAWAPLALAGGRLLARDTRHLVCLDLAEPADP